MSQAADFFVSYTSADRAWAEWIAWQLEAEGYQVVLQAWDFRPGGDFVQQMHKVVQEAGQTIAVLSPAYITSAFGGVEWRAVFAKDPTGEGGLLLPVRVEEVEPPGLLKTRIYVDLVDRDAKSARAALLAAARGARGKPAVEPKFPGAQRQAVGAAEVPRFPAELPPIWNVPHHPNPYFTGREPLLAEVHARLTASELTVRRAALTGLGGVGKTQIAIEHAYRQRAGYDLVWWVRGEQPTTLLGDYAALAGQSPVAADVTLAKDAPQEAAVAAVRAWLERHHRWLLLFDNAEEPQAVAELLPRSGTGHVLVTSRTETGWEHLASPLPVDVLAPAESAGFLLARTGERGPGAEAAATILASKLGGLPLALEQAGAYVAATGTVTLAGYAKLFAARALELLRRGQPLGYQHTVATTWSLALQKLQDSEPAAVGLITLAAFLAPDDLPHPLLTAHHDKLPKPLATATRDPLALADAVAALRRYSLIRIIGDGLFIHRLLQIVVRASLSTEDQQQWAGAAALLVNAAFPRNSNDPNTWPACALLLPHSLAAAEHAQSLGVESEAMASVLVEVAVYLASRGHYRQALTLEERAMAELWRVLGRHHPRTLTSMNNLAVSRRAVGDLQGARDLHEETLTARQRVLGVDHPETLLSMGNLAETRRALGELHAARELHEQTLAGYRRLFGDDHPETLRSMNNLAGNLMDLGDPHGARELHERALAGYRRLFGNDHPETLRLMANLAANLMDLGDPHGARGLLEQTLVGNHRLFGDDHPETLRSMNNLAATRWALGDRHGARELHEQTLAVLKPLLGDDHPNTLQSMNNLAVTRHALGDLHGASELFEEILAAQRRVLGEDHPHTLLSMNNLAVTRHALGDRHGARELHEQTLAARRRVLGDNHPDTVQSMNSLATVRRELG